MTGHHPKNAIAVKFEPQGEWTKLKAVTWQVGKTGVIAPVGEIEPIKILDLQLIELLYTILVL